MFNALKHIALSAFFALSLLLPALAQEADTAVFNALDAKLAGYVKAIEPLDIETQKEECSFLISSCTDSIVRQRVALYLYASYVNSPVMGVEAVAIDIADNWFFNGKVRMKNDIDLMNARIFAEFNRSSLVGTRAPELTMSDDNGLEISLFSKPSNRYSVLYFYDTGCLDCLAQTVMLRTWLNSLRHPLDVYAIYVGSDSLAWNIYRRKRLEVMSSNVSVRNLWDPDLSSDFQRKFGVLKTPQMILIGKDNVILGRRLDVPSLGAMIQNIYASEDYEYGTPESMNSLGTIFNSFGEDISTEDINGVTDRIAARTAGSPSAFKEAVGDLFYYLSIIPDGRYKEGEKYLIDKYILSRPDIWDTASDSLKVIGYARTMSDLLSRSMPGSKVPDISVRGVMAHGKKSGNWDKRSPETWRLSRLRRDTYIMFYDENCSSCQENIASAERLMAAYKKMRVLFVKMPSPEKSGEMSAETGLLLDSFDLTTLPYIVHIDNNGVIKERYVDFIRLERNTFGGNGK